MNAAWTMKGKGHLDFRTVKANSCLRKLLDGDFQI